jgi:hypothetical protein
VHYKTTIGNTYLFLFPIFSVFRHLLCIMFYALFSYLFVQFMHQFCRPKRPPGGYTGRAYNTVYMSVYFPHNSVSLEDKQIQAVAFIFSLYNATSVSGLPSKKVELSRIWRKIPRRVVVCCVRRSEVFLRDLLVKSCLKCPSFLARVCCGTAVIIVCNSPLVLVENLSGDSLVATDGHWRYGRDMVS